MRRLVLVGALAVLGIGIALRQKPADPPASSFVRNTKVPFTAEHEGERLKLAWDPAALANIPQAELHIMDGNHHSRLSLNSSLLAAGSFLYLPITSDVTFRLDAPDGSNLAGPVAASSVLSAARMPPAVASSASANREIESKPPVRPASPGRTRVSVTTEPISNSRVSRAVNKVRRLPLMRRLKNASGRAAPPKPVRQVMPTVSAADRRALVLPLAVDIRVGVDKNGRVKSAEPLGSTNRNTAFARAAVSASRAWKFTPAHVGDKAVPGNVILHFKFQPSTQ